jgi:hypothetical protein
MQKYVLVTLCYTHLIKGRFLSSEEEVFNLLIKIELIPGLKAAFRLRDGSFSCPYRRGHKLESLDQFEDHLV